MSWSQLTIVRIEQEARLEKSLPTQGFLEYYLQIPQIIKKLNLHYFCITEAPEMVEVECKLGNQITNDKSDILFS